MYNSLKTNLITSVPTFIGLIPRRLVAESSRRNANRNGGVLVGEMMNSIMWGLIWCGIYGGFSVENEGE